MQDIDPTQSELRHRTPNVTTVVDDSGEMGKTRRLHGEKRKEKETKEQDQQVRSSSVVFSILHRVVGVLVMLYIAYKVAACLYSFLENKLWFSNIMEVEREISFRTESGLYYSYYKQLVSAPSLSQGLYELTHDNLTEHLHTVNLLARFNIYQEVFLAVLYRTLPFLQTWLPPIFFYVTMVYALQGLLVCSLYSLTWQLTGSWVPGILTAAFYIFNRFDVTRTGDIIALRENFALPFLWVQLAFLNCYFKTNTPQWKQRLCVGGATISTFLFAVCWQFNQFVLLLQAMALFGVQLLQVVPHRKICVVYIIQAVCMLLVCVVQFFNKMIITSLLLSFLPAALLIMALQGQLSQQQCGLKMRLLRMLGYIALVFALMAAINRFVKILLWHEADEHINKFVRAKLGLEDSIDFHVGLYLCNDGFGWLDWASVVRLTQTLNLPLYLITHLVCLTALGIALVQQHRSKADKDSPADSTGDHIFSGRPELAFHTVFCAFLGALAVTTLRMKFIWAPYICIFASLCVSDCAAYKWLLHRFMQITGTKAQIIRFSITVAALAIVTYTALPPLQEQLKYLGEFFDPDTVELMQWIVKDTPPGTAFAGSMQLLAGVKLCTLHPITNHPHYEDKDLRERTIDLYRMYGRQSVKDVHAVLQKYNATYVIVEDSICLRPTQGGCGLPSLVDAHYSKKSDVTGDVQHQTQIPRFCDEIRHLKPDYKKYFRRVFHNRTFRVYRVVVLTD